MNRYEEAMKMLGTVETGPDGVEAKCIIGNSNEVAWVTTGDGSLHRTDGKPAAIDENGDELFYENGRPVRGDRPRMKGNDGSLTYWGEDISERCFGPDGRLKSFMFGNCCVDVFDDGFSIEIW